MLATVFHGVNDIRVDFFGQWGVLVDHQGPDAVPPTVVGGQHFAATSGCCLITLVFSPGSLEIS
jgi:hypothetical protein